MPVSRLARLGEHMAVAMNARVNVIPVRRSSASLGISASSHAGVGGPVLRRALLVGDQQDQVRRGHRRSGACTGDVARTARARRRTHGERGLRRRTCRCASRSRSRAPWRPGRVSPRPPRRAAASGARGRAVPARVGRRRGPVPADGERRPGPRRGAPREAVDAVAAVVERQPCVEEQPSRLRELREERRGAEAHEDVAAREPLGAALALGRRVARAPVLADDAGGAPAHVEAQDQRRARPAPCAAGRPRRRTC